MTPSNRSGQSLVEILIALTLAVITIAVIISVSLGNRAILGDTQNNQEALRLAVENLESTRAMAQNDLSSISSGTTTQGIYTKQITVEDAGTNTKKITSTVTWNTDPLRPQKVELVTIVTDPQGFTKSGGDPGCGSLFGNWENLVSSGSIDLGPGVSATGLDALNNIVYMSGTASSSAKPDFFIIDATNLNSPVMLSSLNTGVGLNAIDVANNYVYVANDSNILQLQIINVANLNSPSLVSSLPLTSILQPGISIFYYDKMVYIGTKRGVGPEFHIVDVSNPLLPLELGSFEVNADVNSVYVNDNLAYISTSDDSKELMVLNIANPLLISQTGSFNALNGDDGKGIYLLGSTVYLGRSAGNNDLALVNVTDPASPSQISYSNLLGASINGIIAQGTLAFLATTDSNKEFQIWNTSNPASPTLVNSFNFPQSASSIDCENNIIYLSVRSNDALRIITSQ